MNLNNIITEKYIKEGEFIEGITLSFKDICKMFYKYICGYNINIAVFNTDKKKEYNLYITYENEK